MTVKERLLEISDLNIAFRLRTMSESDLEGYVKVLNSFVEEFPALEQDAKKALAENNNSSLSKKLAVMHDLLVQIHADALSEECLKQMNGLLSAKHEKIEAFLTYFLSVLTMLSIDIQMAILKDRDALQGVQIEKIKKEMSSETKSILAVDDSAFILGILKNILIEAGYKLTCVTSSADALRFLNKNRPDLFILDIEMPQLNGYELAEKIREIGQSAPIIFLTANSTKEYLIKAVTAGAVDFIVKPINKDHVLSRIAKHI
jgi:CheY-like chemotaxis protein